MRLSGFCLTLALSIGVMPACSSPAGPSARSGRPTIAAPVAVAPQGSLLIGDLDQPITLTVLNPTAPQNAGAIALTFEVSADATFTSLVASRSATADGDRTSVTIDRLPPNGTYYWRAWAAADNAVRTIPVPASFRIGPAIVSGPYRMTIDATGLGCGDLFARPIIVDAVLTRTGQKISFNRPGNGWCGSFPGADCGGVSGTFAGSTFTGTATFQKTALAAPTDTVIWEGELGALGHANPDGTVSGSLTHRFGPDLIVAQTKSTPWTSATCHAAVPWTLTPQ